MADKACVKGKKQSDKQVLDQQAELQLVCQRVCLDLTRWVMGGHGEFMSECTLQDSRRGTGKTPNLFKKKTRIKTPKAFNHLVKYKSYKRL